MRKLIVTASSFLATIIIIALVSSNKAPPSPSPETAQIFQAVQQDQPIIVQKTSLSSAMPRARATFTSTPTPDLVPSILVTAQTPTVTPTSTPTPTRTPTASVVATTTPTMVSTPTRTPTASVVATTTPTSAPTGDVAVVSLTSPVVQNQPATIKIQTDANAECTIEVTLPSGTVSTSKNLGPKTADQNGEVVWSWRINWNTKPGAATIKLSCQSNGQTYSGQTTMQIVASP